jgi:hypothetical protein
MHAPDSPIYQSDSQALPDSCFEEGSLRSLVVGNRGRLLDARRTPIVIKALDRDTGMFEVEIQAFEDLGSRWWVAFEQIGGYQFALESPRADDTVVAGYEATVRKLDRPLTIEVDEAGRVAAAERLRVKREAAGRWLDINGPSSVDVAPRIAARKGDPELMALLRKFLALKDLNDMDEAFATAFVSNPAAGEIVKGHAIVLAEAGLCDYVGKIVRSPTLFAGEWSRARRAQHLLTRMAFTQALWSRAGEGERHLYRAYSSEGRPRERASSSFVSSTFALEVALAHFGGGPATITAGISRQALPLSRLLMTFLETPAMNERYKEGEAVLIGDPANPAF